VSRVWRQFGIQPHRVRKYLASDDPEFEEKAADIIGLYLQPPANAAVFCVDQKSAIQALDRLDPVLPLSPGRAERHGFAYFRHGTLSLSAALNTRTGDVMGKTAPRHTSAEFIDFLSQIVASQPQGREIHIVVDNLSAHKTRSVFQFLQANPSLRIHYTPTYSSWLNQVEIWFSKIQRDVSSRGIFTSTTDLSRKLIRYIKQSNKTATPFSWRFKNAAYRIKPITQRASDSVH
jgi:transposase